MTKDDDLVKRLRAVDHQSVEDCFTQSPLYGDAADRIEQLVAANEALTAQLEAARLDAKEAEAYSVWLEAKLAKAVEALGEIATDEHPLGWIAIAALKELKGDKP